MAYLLVSVDVRRHFGSGFLTQMTADHLINLGISRLAHALRRQTQLGPAWRKLDL